jgi:hypothetical protein
MTAGYSGKGLAAKLGIKTGSTVLVQDAPRPYPQILDPIPDGVQLVTSTRTASVIHIFVTRRSVLARHLQRNRQTMATDAALWVSWPKRSAKVSTDVTEDVIRELCLPLGLVDIKVCAVDETWSGLKLVIRKELRDAVKNNRAAGTKSTGSKKRPGRKG